LFLLLVHLFFFSGTPEKEFSDPVRENSNRKDEYATLPPVGIDTFCRRPTQKHIHTDICIYLASRKAQTAGKENAKAGRRHNSNYKALKLDERNQKRK
jgi:hypothetical protein